MITHKEDRFYNLTITDIFSRYTEIENIWDIGADIISKTIENKWIEKYGSPDKELSDQSVDNTKATFLINVKKHKIKHLLTSANSSTGSLISERINQTITTVLRTMRN